MRAGAGEQLAGKGIVGFFALMEGRITENIIIAAADAGQPITGDHLGFQPQPGTVQAGAVRAKASISARVTCSAGWRAFMLRPITPEPQPKSSSLPYAGAGRCSNSTAVPVSSLPWL